MDRVDSDSIVMIFFSTVFDVVKHSIILNGISLILDVSSFCGFVIFLLVAQCVAGLQVRLVIQ